MQNELVDEPCRQRRRHTAAAHQADVLIPGGLARRSDRVLDPCGDERLTRADLRRWPMTENEQPCRRVWAVASPVAGAPARAARASKNRALGALNRNPPNI